MFILENRANEEHKNPATPFSLADCEVPDTCKEIQVTLLTKEFHFPQKHEAIPGQSIRNTLYIRP